ncbi:hypothetical protein CSHISOI_09990 [Colletotrichum shisoi]|uniref:Ubiquitin-like protease family profile domain-containing protein n=1 Tax=Colletotrichum shisoi TaxID=2078593 RepID=A0A5Q4BF94_9PEZI|nr:hypothetical protein CSHISOI_09990 [Colletotrichum shisoi]
MTVQTLLTRLNLLGEELHQREEILALQNVHSKTLELVTNTSYAEEINGLHPEIARRCKNVCARLETTLSVFIFCFGTTITSSRPCLDALNSLQQSHPSVSVFNLHINPDIWNRQQPRAAESLSVVPKRTNQLEPELELEPKPEPEPEPESEPELGRTAELLAAAPFGQEEVGFGGSDGDKDRVVRKHQRSISTQLHSPGRDAAFVHGDFDAATGAYSDESQNDDDGMDGERDELSTDDEDSLLELAKTPDNLHNDLSTILEESSSQLAAANTSAANTPEQGRRSQPPTASPVDSASSFKLQPDLNPGLGEFGTTRDSSPMKLLSDGVVLRRFRKRSLSTSGLGLLPKSGYHSDSETPAQAQHKRIMLSSPSPEAKTTNKNVQRTALEPVMASLATLLPKRWVNDLVIHTISQRFTSTRVGVIDSLVLCAAKSARLQLRLGQVVCKDEVVIFLNEPGHWILFRWLRASGVLEECDSLRPAHTKRPGAERAKAFLRWACAQDNMAIELRQVEQRNDSDCGVFALCFARRLVDGGEELDDLVDSDTERIYFSQCLFTSQNLSLKPPELRAIGLAVPDDRELRARQVPDFARRRRTYHDLLRDGSAGSASTGHIRRAAAADVDSLQRAGLAAVVSSLHQGHVTSLASALQTAAMVAAAAAEGEHERDVRDKLQQFLDALGQDKDPLAKVSSSSSLHSQVLRGSLVALRENGVIALSMWEALSHQPKVETEPLRRNLHDEYAMCCAYLVVLDYTVTKFRQARMKRGIETGVA